MNNQIKLCQDERHLKKLEGIKQDLESLKNLTPEDIPPEIATLHKYVELAGYGFNTYVLGEAIKTIRDTKERLTGTPNFQEFKTPDVSGLKKKIGDIKRDTKSHFAVLGNLQPILPDTDTGAAIHEELQETLKTLQDVLNRRSQLAMYEICYPVLAGLVGLRMRLTSQTLQAVRSMYTPEDVENIVKTITDPRERKKDTYAKIMRGGIKGIWKEGILEMFEECQRIGKNKVDSYQVILDFLATVYPLIWGFTEETKAQLIKSVEGYCTR